MRIEVTLNNRADVSVSCQYERDGKHDARVGEECDVARFVNPEYLQFSLFKLSKNMTTCAAYRGQRKAEMQDIEGKEDPFERG